MKKVLLGSAAIALGLAMAAPAQAEVSLGLGGHFKGYVTYISQDDTAAVTEERKFDILRETEIHFSGETTLDNGLTVGAHVEADVDTGDSFAVDESYAYFSGAWGRVNFGNEDGAAYLLQVAAPSADSNYDGIRQYVNPFNATVAGVNAVAAFAGSATNLVAGITADGLDYDNDATTSVDKITYLTPVFSGFQVGASYTPDVAAAASNSLGGVGTDDAADVFGDAYEIAARYEGQFESIGIVAGAGYTTVEEESDTAATTDEDFDEWNVGLDLNWGAFGLGAVYTENNNGHTVLDNNETWVVGADYTTGPYKLGVSYLENETDIGGAAAVVESDRWTGGVVYTYGPGMTFRGSISFVDHDIQGAAADTESTNVLLGTQIEF